MSDPKKPGRPAKSGAALSPAQRVKQCRDRAHEAALVASENVPGATTTALLGNLQRQIKLIDTDPAHAPTARDIAGEVMAELCKRFQITITLR